MAAFGDSICVPKWVIFLCNFRFSLVSEVLIEDEGSS